MFDACDHCGEVFEPDVRYPVVTRDDPDGTVAVFSFCDADCAESWRDDPQAR